MLESFDTNHDLSVVFSIREDDDDENENKRIDPSVPSVLSFFNAADSTKTQHRYFTERSLKPLVTF